MVHWLLVLACDGPPPSGTLVGNPGKAQGRLAPPGGFELAEATSTITVDLVGCEAGLADVVAQEPVDLVEGFAFDVPGGRWCGLVVELDQPLGFVAERASPPAELVVELEWPAPVTAWAEGALDIDGDDFVLELGAPDWLPADLLEEGREEVGADSELSRLVAADLAAGTALFADDDGDGELDEGERAAGPVAAARFSPPAALSEGAGPARVSIDGGCQTNPGPAPWLGLLAWLGLRATRRASRSRGHARRR